MIDENKELIISIQSIIDLILEEQNTYAIDRNLMIKLNKLINKYENLDNNFIVNYLNFIEVFSPFFDMLIDRVKMCENELINSKQLISDCFFTFSFSEFQKKDILIPYNGMLESLNEMFKDNNSLQGIIFFMHLNTLLKRYKFMNNKIGLVNNVVIIDIDYASRISYYKEEYITNFRHELEKGLRNGVFLDDDDIISYINKKIEKLEYELDI